MALTIKLADYDDGSFDPNTWLAIKSPKDPIETKDYIVLLVNWDQRQRIDTAGTNTLEPIP